MWNDAKRDVHVEYLTTDNINNVVFYIVEEGLPLFLKILSCSAELSEKILIPKVYIRIIPCGRSWNAVTSKIQCKNWAVWGHMLQREEDIFLLGRDNLFVLLEPYLQKQRWVWNCIGKNGILSDANNRGFVLKCTSGRNATYHEARQVIFFKIKGKN